VLSGSVVMGRQARPDAGGVGTSGGKGGDAGVV
jgi:hypothetical protein